MNSPVCDPLIPIIPSPPPSETARAIAPPDTPAIGAPMTGVVRSNQRVSGVRITYQFCPVAPYRECPSLHGDAGEDLLSVAVIRRGGAWTASLGSSRTATRPRSSGAPSKLASRLLRPDPTHPALAASYGTSAEAYAWKSPNS